LSSSRRRVSEEYTHRVFEHSMEKICKVCIERKVPRREQISPLEGNKRADTLRRLSISKISEEIMKGVCGK
jgi:hypothetical protein